MPQGTSEELARALNELNTIIETIPDVFFMLDTNARLIRWNRRVEIVTGYSPEELMGRPADSFFPEAEVPQIAEAIAEAFEKGFAEVEAHAVTKSGTLIPYHYSGAPLKDEKGNVIGLVGMGRDITERRRAEEEIRALNARLEQRVGERTAELDRALAEAHLLSAIVASSSGEDDLGRILTTALGHLQEMIPFSGGSIALVEGDNLVIRAAVGRFAERALGQSLPRGKGKSWEIVETAQPFLCNDLAAAGLKAKNPITSYLAVPLIWRGRAYGLLEVDSGEANAFDSTHLALMQRVAAELSGPIELARRYGIEVRAVAEAEAAREALHVAKEEAVRANQAKSEFLSRMSHELRTPLNAILGFAQLLQMDSLAAGQKESVEHILKGGKHLLELINEVLDIGRIEAGRLGLSLEPVHLREMIRHALDLVTSLAAERNVHLRYDAAGTTGRYVLADRQRLTQVVLNLLANGVKYNTSGGTVTVTGEEAGQGRWRIKVSDTGPGISPDHIERLFIPFERLGAERTGVEGTGLGLALSRRLVEAMGGTMGVESTVGIGSTFWVELPAAESPGERLDARAAGQGTPAAEPAPRPRIVLYMEDNLSNLDLIQRLLSGRPEVRIIPASQGRGGLDLAREHRPHLIILDLHLPDISGDEVLQRLRDDPKTRHIPVIVIGADAAPRRIQRLLARGARDVLTKPLDVRKFLATLGSALEKQEPDHAESHA